MSFYFFDDDDESEKRQSGNNKNPEEEEFLCTICGSTEYYEENTKLICSNCFTQSQSAAHSQQIDTDEVWNLAARHGRGGILATREKKKKRTDDPRAKLPTLQALDRSRKLPNLKLCIDGFQTVLKGGVAAVARIMKFNSKEEVALKESVRSIWLTYLRVWSEAAERYGAIHPELRFSMRDNFFGSLFNNAIFMTVSYKIKKRMKLEAAEKGKRNSEGKGATPAPSGAEQNLNTESNQRMERSSSAPPLPTTSGQRVKIDSTRAFTSLFEEKGRLEAALSLRPSMNFAAAILYLAVSPSGIIPGQVINWIFSGDLPLINAYKTLLTEDQRREFSATPYVFKMRGALLSSTTLEKQAAELAVVCGIESTEQLPQHKCDKTNNKHSKRKVKKEGKQPIRRLRFVPLKNIPRMLNQLVADLGFGQRVLDNALALTGNKPTQSSKTKPLWLPKPLKRAQPIEIDSPEYALAVIIVACKMCPGWETWSYSFRFCDVQQQGPAVMNDGRGVPTTRRQFIPWTDEEAHHLEYGELSSYLDFYEESFFDDSETPMRELLSELGKSSEMGTMTEQDGIGHKPKRDRDSIDDINTLATGAPKTYLSYPEKQHCKKRKSFEAPSSLTHGTFHPCYSNLVRYVGYKMRTDACLIHSIVVHLDEEVVAIYDKSKHAKAKAKYRRERKYFLKNINRPKKVGSDELHQQHEEGGKTHYKLPSTGTKNNQSEATGEVWEGEELKYAVL